MINITKLDNETKDFKDCGMVEIEFNVVARNENRWVTTTKKGYIFEHRGVLFVAQPSLEFQEKGLYTVTDYMSGGRIATEIVNEDVDQLIEEFKEYFDMVLKKRGWDVEQYVKMTKHTIESIGFEYPINDPFEALQ